VYDRVTWDFVCYVWNYRATMRPRVRALIDQHAGHAHAHAQVTVLTSRRAARRWLIAATAAR